MRKIENKTYLGENALSLETRGINRTEITAMSRMEMTELRDELNKCLGIQHTTTCEPRLRCESVARPAAKTHEHKELREVLERPDPRDSRDIMPPSGIKRTTSTTGEPLGQVLNPPYPGPGDIDAAHYLEWQRKRYSEPQVAQPLRLNMVRNVEKFKAGPKAKFSSWYATLARCMTFDGIIPDDQKNHVLILYLSQEEAQIAHHLILPQTVSNILHVELVNTLKHYFDTPTETPLHRLSFSQILQGANEPTPDFIIRLRTGAVECGFNLEIDSRVMDQLLTGISNYNTKCKLLECSIGRNLKFQEGCEIALSYEAVQDQARKLHQVRRIVEEQGTSEKRGRNSVVTRDECYVNRAEVQRILSESGEPIFVKEKILGLL
jgi:hypothetical protein